MTDRKATYVHQRQPLPVPESIGDMRRFVQTMEEILDDIYRRYGRLKLTDFDKTVNDTLKTAQESADAAQEAADDAQEAADAAQEAVDAVQETADAALVTAAKADATSPEMHGGTSGDPISSAQISTWAAEAEASGKQLGLHGSDLVDYISNYIKQKIAEA